MNKQVKDKSANIDKAALFSEMVFEGMQRAFVRAKHAHPDKVFESSFILADQVIEMRVVGHELAETMGSVFAHLQTNGKHSPPPAPRHRALGSAGDGDTLPSCLHARRLIFTPALHLAP